jgi:hypothetical protein
LNHSFIVITFMLAQSDSIKRRTLQILFDSLKIEGWMNCLKMSLYFFNLNLFSIFFVVVGIEKSKRKFQNVRDIQNQAPIFDFFKEQERFKTDFMTAAWMQKNALKVMESVHNDYISLLLIIAILWLFRPNLEGAQKPLLVRTYATGYFRLY